MPRILVDTSVWVDHLRQNDEHLAALLKGGQVLVHPMVWGELACGYLHNRSQILSLLKNLPRVSVATQDEALYCLEANQLMGKGIGLIDLHLLSSVLLTKNTLLWTRDRRLHKSAISLMASYSVPH